MGERENVVEWYVEVTNPEMTVNVDNVATVVVERFRQNVKRLELVMLLGIETVLFMLTVLTVATETLTKLLFVEKMTAVLGTVVETVMI